VKGLRARPFGSLAATLSYYQMSNLDATGWSRLRAVCICAAGVDMITMLEEKRSRRAILCGIPALADTGTEDMQAIIARERAAGVDGLALAEVTYPHVTGRRSIPGHRDRLEIRSGEPILKSPGDLS
jgi:hypothetical protein